MPKSSLPFQTEKPGHSGRRFLFIVLSLLLTGVVGLGTLKVYQAQEQDEASLNSANKASATASDHLLANSESTTNSNPDSIAEKSSTASLDSAEEQESDPDDLNGPYEDEPYEDAEDEEKGLLISGAVLDNSGGLLPGISISARLTRQQTNDQGSVQTSSGDLRQLTDRLGSFTFDGLSEGEYELSVAESPQYHPTKLRVRAGVANAELVLQLIRSVRVYGVITDDVGNQLEGVEVRALGENLKVHSDVTGAYEIQTGPGKAGQFPVLDFSKVDYQDSRQRVEAALDDQNTEVRLDVEMEWESDASKVAVFGRVMGPNGEPVDGASIWISTPEYQSYEKVRSNALGEYQFKSVKVGDSYTLGVEPPEKYTVFKSDLFSIGPDDLKFDVNLDAAEFADLSGTVTDLNGLPLSGFSLWARSMDMGRQQLIPVYTDGAGQFQLERVPSGAIKLESRSQPRLEATGIVLKAGESRQVEVPLDWGKNWLLGQVVDEQGDPVSRAKVVLRWTQSFFDVSSESRREVMSDQGGFFALSNLDAQYYILTVEATGYLSSRVEYQRGQGEAEVRVMLQRSSTMN